MAALLELGVDLGLVLTFLVAFGLLAVHRGIVTPALVGLANLLDRISVPIPRHHVHLFGPVSSALRWAVKAGDRALSALVLTSEKGAVFLWHALAQQAKWLGGLLGDLAETVETRFHRLLFALPPFALLWLAVRTAQQVKALPGRVAALVHYVTRDLPGRIRAAQAAALAATAALAHRLTVVWHAATVTLPHRIDLIGDGIRWVGRTLRATRAQVARHARLLTAAGSAALVAAALARLGVGWLRCGRVSRLGKRACGMDADLLETLLAQTLVIAGTISLVEFAEGMSGVVDTLEAPIRRFWRVA